MKWLSKLFKGGGASRRRAAAGGQQPHSYGDGNIFLRTPSKSSVLISYLYNDALTFGDILDA